MVYLDDKPEWQLLEKSLMDTTDRQDLSNEIDKEKVGQDYQPAGVFDTEAALQRLKQRIVLHLTGDLKMS